MRVYYNEFDPYAADWLRNLMRDGLIPVGDVDERDIREVMPDDVRGYDHCHFFAGIGGWAYAARLADWTGPLWTGSCPCQPFSVAGKRKGISDDRHLWPEFHRLIAECQPATVVGEQVASKDGRAWLAGVFADMERVGYAVAGADLCAAGVHAPHIRQRLWWMADAGCVSSAGRGIVGDVGGATVAPQGREEKRERLRDTLDDGRADGGLAVTGNGGEPRGFACKPPEGAGAEDARASVQLGRCGSGRGLGDTNGTTGSRLGSFCVALEPEQEASRPAHSAPWSQWEVIGCLDGKARRIEPGLEPLVNGLTLQAG